MPHRTSNSIMLASVVVFAVTACAPTVLNQQPNQIPAPGPTQSTTTMTPQDVWDTFVQIADNSCKEAYSGLVEEDIAGPNLGKLKVRLTYEQAGENTMASFAPNGDAEILLHHQFFACEAQFLFITLDEDGSAQGLLEYSPDWPIAITFDSQTGTYSTSQVLEDGSIRDFVYTVTNNLFTTVEEVGLGAVTTLTYGQPNATLTQSVNDFYDDYFGY